MTTNTNFTNNMSYDDFADAMIDRIGNSTSVSILDELSALPRNSNTDRLGIIAMASACSAKKVVTMDTDAAGYTFPARWTVNNSANFTMLAMTGHIIFMMPEESLYAKAKKGKAAYKTTIGGKENILEFGDTGVVVGKPVRTEILQEWSKRLKEVDLVKARVVLSKAFPKLVKPAPNVSRFFNPAFYFSLFVSFMYFLLRTLLSLVWTLTLGRYMRWVNLTILFARLSTRQFIINRVVSFLSGLYSIAKFIFLRFSYASHRSSISGFISYGIDSIEKFSPGIQGTVTGFLKVSANLIYSVSIYEVAKEVYASAIIMYNDFIREDTSSGEESSEANAGGNEIGIDEVKINEEVLNIDEVKATVTEEVREEHKEAEGAGVIEEVSARDEAQEIFKEELKEAVEGEVIFGEEGEEKAPEEAPEVGSAEGEDKVPEEGKEVQEVTGKEEEALGPDVGGEVSNTNAAEPRVRIEDYGEVKEKAMEEL